MKVLIVFFAMLIINVSFLSFNSDLNRYVKLQIHLKALAEESASGASLFNDIEAYSNGVLSIDEEAASDYTNFLIETALERDAIFRRGNISANIVYFDSIKGYEGLQSYKIQNENPAVVVTLTYFGDDLFRLPFVCVDTVSRTATYQWEDGLTSLF
ncbi:MAG: hypothetical protein EOM59_00420 [Clostridia bacterium]|nr:hypothetical protein [Clostridia bacterium]